MGYFKGTFKMTGPGREVLRKTGCKREKEKQSNGEAHNFFLAMFNKGIHYNL
jgi:hypothetical protein